MATVNPLRHPQTLFAGFKEDDPRMDRLVSLVGEFRLLSDPDDFRSLRAHDWDLLIVEGTDLGAFIERCDPYLHVLALGCRDVGMAVSDIQRGGSSTHFAGVQNSRTLRIPDALPPRVRRLIDSESVPLVNEMDAIPYLRSYHGSFERYAGSFCTPFLLDADGHVVAGSFRRSEGSKSVCWALPHTSASPELWLAAALEQWSQTYPKRFPSAAPWRHQSRWMAAEERGVADRQEALSADWAAQTARFRSQEQALAADAEVARGRAETGPRRLLTSQSEELVSAVVDALSTIGFDVEDVDRLRESGGLAKVEDLQITSPESRELRTIIEVKGLIGWARQNDIHQLARHSAKFATRHGNLPDRQWYVVNQFMRDDPRSRETALASAPEAVSTFAEDGGLVIDTRELFAMSQDVHSGTLAAEAARKLLMDGRGVLRYTD